MKSWGIFPKVDSTYVEWLIVTIKRMIKLSYRDSNPGIWESKSHALPLGDSPVLICSILYESNVWRLKTSQGSMCCICFEV